MLLLTKVILSFKLWIFIDKRYFILWNAIMIILKRNRSEFRIASWQSQISSAVFCFLLRSFELKGIVRWYSLAFTSIKIKLR